MRHYTVDFIYRYLWSDISFKAGITEFWNPLLKSIIVHLSEAEFTPGGRVSISKVYVSD
jgi:hypothetical protein